jgi:arabinofuranosyltransferase
MTTPSASERTVPSLPASPTAPATRSVRVARWLHRWWPVLVPLVVVLTGSWAYRWVDEDAFINFRIIHNLLAGHGPVFNVGERVEVDSDPLWVATLAALRIVFPFVGLPWLSVVLGLACTAGAFLAGGRAVVRLAGRGTSSAVYPVGLLVISSVAGVWEFATSGLEMSMVFLWFATGLLALVRVEARRSRPVWTAVLLGLGPLIRPELAPAAGVLLVALGIVMTAPDWSGPMSRLRRFGVPLAAALALPCASEVARMAYYGLVVPNTALAKTADSSWWSQGLAYLWNFVGPYWLWLPALACALLFGLAVRDRWRTRDRLAAVLLAAPVVAGATDLLYVVYVGGDYMHARLLLPAFFAIFLPVTATGRQLRTVVAVPVAGVAVWSVVCVGWLRYGAPPGNLNPQVVSISNERNTWVKATGNAHPITTADYDHALSGIAGHLLARTAAAVPPGRQRLVVDTDPYAPVPVASAVPAHSSLPFSLVVNVPAIGVIGDLAGPKVYIFDTFSLANPIGSHITVPVHHRPGHEKEISAAWMVARFTAPGTRLPPGGPSPHAVAAARAALSCGPLAAYLHAITAPLTLRRALSDIAHAVGWTTLSFSEHPVRAEHQLCGRTTGHGR